MLRREIHETRVLRKRREVNCHVLLMVGLFLTCRKAEYARKEAELMRKLEQREREYKSTVRQLQHKVKLQPVVLISHFERL